MTLIVNFLCSTYNKRKKILALTYIFPFQVIDKEKQELPETATVGISGVQDIMLEEESKKELSLVIDEEIKQDSARAYLW